MMEAFNESDEPIGVYIRKPGPTDIARGPSLGVLIRGHVGNERDYEKNGYALSGCVTRPT